MGLYDYTIYNVIRRNARIYGDRPAWVYEEQRVTHQQFLEKVDQLACGLLGAGLERGDRIGVLAQNSLEFVYLYAAAARLGTIMLPINWRLKPEEIEYIISDGSPKFIFAGSEFQPIINPLISQFNFIEKCYATDQAGGNFTAFDELMENDGVCPDPDVGFEDAYVIIHTAAVAGRPRGATLSHKGLLISNLQSMNYLSLTNKDCNLVMLPLFHLAGLGIFMNIVQAGGVNIVLPKFDVDRALRHIQEDKVTIFASFPPMLSTLLDKAKEGGYDISSLRVAIGLEHPETAKRFEEMSGGTFWTAFGQSETSGFVTFAPYFEKPGSAGMPSFVADVEIVDDHGKLVETGKPGEIVVRGPMVFNGYWNLEKDNEYTFRDGWHHTGDMGRFDEEGYLWYTGRKPDKELIKPGGENVYPAEVEKAILEHPLVEEASVIGVPDEQWGEAIKAICVLKKGASLAEADLIEFVADRIARYKKPKYIVFVSSLPKSKDGLIDRSKIKADYI
ncbi:MAG: AMP-binding protein [Thermodesulfobacteriota bacterium]|nr:AMP-binding protein [Thermodesulfobacteriota bacterium]